MWKIQVAVPKPTQPTAQSIRPISYMFKMAHFDMDMFSTQTQLTRPKLHTCFATSIRFSN